MINKKVLSEIDVYSGEIKMPKGFEIDRSELIKNITLTNYYQDINLNFSKEWDKVKNFMSDFFLLEHKLNLVPQESFGTFFERNETSKPMITANPADLINSSDYVFLYGVGTDTETCEIVIHYDNKRQANQVYRHRLETNEFIMFPATQLYYIENNNNHYLNYIQTILFKWV